MFDLFVALCSMDFPRNHPVFMALLYTYCPAAAGWWGSGKPLGTRDLPYNVAWQVLTDFSSGINLSQKLEEYGLKENTIIPIVTYINKVANLRQRKAFQRAPELSEDGIVVLDDSLRFGGGVQNVFADHFGGDWRNAFEYARLWVYGITDWLRDIYGGEQKEFEIQPKYITFRALRVNISIRYPVFVWSSEAGRLTKPTIGFLADGAVHNQFRSVMGMMSAPDKDHAWEEEPRIYALDPRTGTAELFEPVESPEQLIEDLVELGNAVKEGPFPPVAAFADPAKCKACVFRLQCYSHRNELSEFARQKISPKRSLMRAME